MTATTSMRLLGLDGFPIMGWASVPQELTRPQVFEAIRGAGINVFMTTGAGGEATGPLAQAKAIRSQLDLAGEFGLRAIVCDRRVHPAKRPRDDAWKRAADEAIADYGRHPAFGGLYVFDEPEVNDPTERCDVQDVAAMVAHLTAQMPERLAYVNALGFGARGMNCYAEYLDTYVRVIDPQMVSVDSYPLTTVPDESLYPGFVADDAGLRVPELGGYYREAYWEAWETQSRVARRYGKPTWGFALGLPHAHSQWFYGPVTEGTLRLEAFTALAYGAEAVQYFTLTSQTASGLGEDAILDADGRPSHRYDLFRRVNRDVAVLGAAINALTPKGVYYRGYVPSGGSRFRFGRRPGDASHLPLARVDGEGNLLLSFLDGADGQRYLLALNNHPARRDRFRITLMPGWTLYEVNRHTGQLSWALGDSHVANFEPGDASLFRMVREPEAAGGSAVANG